MGQQIFPTNGSIIILNRDFCKSWTTSVEGHINLKAHPARLPIPLRERDDFNGASTSPSSGHLEEDVADYGSHPKNEQLVYNHVQFVDFNRGPKGRTKSSAQTKQQTKDARKLIRSHAMKAVHQRRRAQKESAKQSSTTKQSSTVFVDPDGHVDEQVPKLEPDSPSNCLRSLAFHGGYPVREMNSRSVELLTYYVQFHLKQIFSPIPKATREAACKTWFAIAICDELLFRTLLLIASATSKSVGNTCPLQEADSLARPIYSLLRQRLSDVTISEATLGAVSCLVAAERLLGHHERQAAHQAGLVELLRLKGGLDACSHAVRHKILRSDALMMRRCVDMPASPYRWTSLAPTLQESV